MISSQAASQPKTILRSILPHFTAEVCFIGAQVYTMTARDLSHYLSCELALEIRECEDESAFGDVICRFPVIDEEYLGAFVWDDATLMALIMTQFYVKVLEQLLLFCANHNALQLVIHVNPLEASNLDVYKEFSVHREQVLTHQGRKIALVIPPDRATHDKLIAFMEKITADFHKTLLKEQRDNSIIRQYLKLGMFGSGEKQETFDRDLVRIL